jgi:hypothetical protein
LRICLVELGHDDVGPDTCQLERGGATDATAGTGDDRYLFLQFHMTLLPSRGSASNWPTRDLSYFAEQRVGVERRLPAHYVLVNLVNP